MAFLVPGNFENALHPDHDLRVPTELLHQSIWFPVEQAGSRRAFYSSSPLSLGIWLNLYILFFKNRSLPSPTFNHTPNPDFSGRAVVPTRARRRPGDGM